jgi:hypothetical protein
MRYSHALKLRDMMHKAAAALSDRDASLAAELSPGYPADGSLMAAGTRIRWKGALYRASADLWATAENDPDHAPALWEKILYREGIRIIPEVIPAALAFELGERGWWGDTLYESRIAANVYTPAQYAAGWKEIP